MKKNFRLYIKFREGEIFRSPFYPVEIDCESESDFDDDYHWTVQEFFQDDNVNFPGLSMDCDIESFNSSIILLMFESYSDDFVANFIGALNKHFTSPIPQWSNWENIFDLDEAYK